MELEWSRWFLALLGTLIIGIAKAGVKGIDVVIVIIMALVFGSKASTGVIVPLLIVGDIMAVIFYNRHTQWRFLLKFLPWTVVGLLVGVYYGKDLPEEVFKQGMAAVIFINVIIMLWWDLRKSKTIPSHWTFAGSMGLFSGFATMVGNLAAGFANLFFLAMRIPKDQFIGTAAWLFLLMNLIKTPFHIFAWETISTDTLKTNLLLIPAVFLGFFIGVRLVRLINEAGYRRLILILTALGSIFMFFK